MSDYMELLRDLASVEPTVHVFGSVAEAVLLDGMLWPSHGDLDVLVARDEFDLRLEQFGRLGFDGFEVYYEPRRGLPMVLGAARGDLHLEVSLVDVDLAGHPYFAVRTEGAVVAISMPDDLFDWPATVVAGVRIHTLSPLALFRIRAGITATGAFGAPQSAGGAARQERLRRTFLSDIDDATLWPTITPLVEP